MKRAVILSGLAALALTSLSVGAIAQQSDMPQGRGGPQGAPHMDFATLDANGDGQVTQDELDAAAAKRFSEADSDGNGTVSVEEMVARMQAMAEQRREDRQTRMAERMIARLDQNDDGVLSADEMKPGAAPAPKTMFERLDKNGDGAISEEEFAAAKDRMDKMRDRPGKFGPRMGGRDGRHMGDHGDRDGSHRKPVEDADKG
ncbi:EF-hand domain-containing protein [Pseudooceanicola sediminis]|nr:EF-hand domain-containing protein [Pseudooceanicola sediminis]|tara:strand:+ start:31305 stop:31910 length:606 start_codon:yes stop_codon:yes gene_type:complete